MSRLLLAALLACLVLPAAADPATLTPSQISAHFAYQVTVEVARPLLNDTTKVSVSGGLVTGVRLLSATKLRFYVLLSTLGPHAVTLTTTHPTEGTLVHAANLTGTTGTELDTTLTHVAPPATSGDIGQLVITLPPTGGSIDILVGPSGAFLVAFAFVEETEEFILLFSGFVAAGPLSIPVSSAEHPSLPIGTKFSVIIQAAGTILAPFSQLFYDVTFVGGPPVPEGRATIAIFPGDDVVDIHPPNGTATTFKSPVSGSSVTPASTVSSNCPPPATDQQGTAAGEPQADPVNLWTLEFVHRFYAMGIPGPGLPFRAVFTYRSQVIFDGPFGHGVEYFYNKRLVTDPDGPGLVYYDGTSRGDRFVPVTMLGKTVLVREGGGRLEKIVELSDGTLVLRRRDGYREVYHGPSAVLAGKLKEIQDANGNRLRFEYDSEKRLSLVLDGMGRPITHEWNPDGRLQIIRDYTGRECVFSYDTAGNMIECRSPLVIGTPNGNDFPNGRVTKFGYDDPHDPHNLTSITQPNEAAVSGSPSLVLLYTPDDKVSTQTWGGTNVTGIPAGGSMTFTQATTGAGTHETTFTDRNSNVTVFAFNSAGQVAEKRELTRGLRPGDPTAFITRYLYSSHGYLKKLIFPEGNSVEFVHDESNPEFYAQGNVITQILDPGPRGGDQPVITYSYTYEPVYQRLASVTSARGNHSGYTPDNGGASSPERYTTRLFYGYQEAADAAAPAPWLLKTSEEIALFAIDTAGALAVGKGDLNEDGHLEHNCSCPIRIEATPVKLTARQAAFAGEATQPIVTTLRYTERSYLAEITNPGGNVTSFTYHPENDPGGEGIAWNGGGSSAPFGYLKSVTVDARVTPRRIQTAPPVKLTTTLHYDRVGNTLHVTSPRGIRSEIVYNAINEPLRFIRAADVSGAAGNPFEPGGLVAFAYKTDLFYDHNGNAVKIEVENRDANNGKPLGPKITTRIIHDILDNVLEMQQEEQTGVFLTSRLRYDPNTNPVAAILPRAVSGTEPGNTVSRTWDERDLPLAVTGAPGTSVETTTTFFFDKNGNLKKLLDGESHPTTFTFDGYDRRKTITNAVGTKADYTWDPDSLLRSVSVSGTIGGPSPADDSGSANTLLARTTLLHDDLGRRFQVDRHLFTSTGVTTHRPVTLTDGPLSPGDGKVTTLVTFDRLGRVIAVTPDDLKTGTVTYDGANRAILIRDPEGNARRLFYNDGSLVIRVEDTDKGKTSAGTAITETFASIYVWDSLGRLSRATDNLGHTRYFSYDSRNNQTGFRDAIGPLLTDPLGLYTAAKINAPGNSRSYFFDGLSRMTRSVADLRVGGTGGGAINTSNPHNPDGKITIDYAWNENSLLSSLVDDNGNTTSYEFDPLDRVKTSTFADGTKKRFEYNREHRLIRFTDQNASVHTVTLDAVYRQVTRSITRAASIIGTTSMAFQWDGLSRLTKATDNNDPDTAADDSTVTRAWDSLSRLLEEGQKIGDIEKFVSLQWKADNNLDKLTYPTGRSLSYKLDDLDRIKTLDLSTPSAGSERISTLHYIGSGRLLEKVNGNGTRLSFLGGDGKSTTYDGLRRITSLRHLNKHGVFASFAYTYDRENNRTSETRGHDGGKGFTASYDSTYRVTGYTDSFAKVSRKQSWSLDGVGNWRKFTSAVTGTPKGKPQPASVSVEPKVNSMNEYTSFMSPQAHDDNGNRTRDERHLYAHDALDRLRKVWNAKTGRLIATYSYDAFGRRVKKAVERHAPSGPAASGKGKGHDKAAPGHLQVVLFFYSGPIIIEELDAKGRHLASTIYAAGLAARVLRDGKQHGGIVYYHTDGKAWCAALTAKNGQVVERYVHSAYGEVSFLGPSGKPNGRGSSAVGNPFVWVGTYYNDAETGLYKPLFRSYDPRQGRFLHRDPLGYADGMGLLEYSGSKAINGVDPWGLKLQAVKATGEGSVAAQGGFRIYNDRGTFLGNYYPETGVFKKRNSKTGEWSEEDWDFLDRFSNLHGGWLGEPPPGNWYTRPTYRPDAGDYFGETVGTFVEMYVEQPLARAHQRTEQGKVELGAGEYGEGAKSFGLAYLDCLGVASLVVPGPKSTGTAGPVLASGAAGGTKLPMTVVRTIKKGEKVADILNEVKALTFSTGVEHAVVKLASGARVIVSGGSGGIVLAPNVVRVYVHTHPYHLPGTGQPSLDDLQMLAALGEKMSWLIEHGLLIPFSR